MRELRTDDGEGITLGAGNARVRTNDKEKQVVNDKKGRTKCTVHKGKEYYMEVKK